MIVTIASGAIAFHIAWSRTTPRDGGLSGPRAILPKRTRYDDVRRKEFGDALLATARGADVADATGELAVPGASWHAPAWSANDLATPATVQSIDR